MDNKISSITLSAILVLALSACNMGGTPTPPPDQGILIANAIDLTVQADPPGPITTVGQTINYTYFITNSGTESLPGVVSVVGATVNCPAVNTVGNMNEFLDPGEVLTCVSSYTTVQADLDAGSVTSITTANVNGTLSNQVTTTVTTTPNRILTLSKSASPQVYEQIGQTITYTYVITNSGALDIGPAQFTVTDAGIGNVINCGNPDTTLAPNATVTCSAPYTITEADMNADSISTSATASGGGVGPSQPVSADVTKSGLVQNPANLPVGSTVQHKVVKGEWLWQIARCYGADPAQVVRANSQLPNPAQISPDITVSVPNIGTVGNIYGPPCVGSHTVQSGETWNSIALKYNADPLVLQIVNAYSMPIGSVIKVPLNSAGGTITTSKTLSLTTSADLTVYSQLGQIITFTYIIENTGNTTLGPAQFTVNDPLVSTSPLNCGGPEITLAPGATVQCTSIYAITAGDLEAQSVTNTATASGGGASPSQPASATIHRSNVGLTITPAATPLTYNQAGQVITFTLVIRNSGNTSIGPAQFTISDSRFGAGPINCGPADTTLAPEQTVTCTFTYTITDADMTVLSIQFNPTASGGGAGPSAPASITINRQ